MGSWSRRREDESSPGLTIGMFSGSDTEGQEERKKGGTPRGRVFIGLLCQSYSSTGRKPNWYCRHLFRRDLLSKALARRRPPFVFFLASTRDFFLFLFSNVVTLLREIWRYLESVVKAAYFIHVINAARTDPPKGLMDNCILTIIHRCLIMCLMVWNLKHECHLTYQFPILFT